ncbi:SDR family oxidoreductase [Nocardioides sp. Bht2]|uniref:SDR family oxidoreductase n=1 Tax=Nocardioides sp. Bht2 TaxID=3392297 RepID=UPI0039B4BCEC
MDLQLDQRVYLVTGGSGGLGRATAEQLVADGAKVLISGRSEEALQHAVSELGPNAAFEVADNADPASAERLVAATLARFGRLDGVLISVGGPPTGTPITNTDEQWQASFDSVFLGAVRIARSAAAVLGEGGSITFVLSSSVKAPLEGLAISNGFRPGLAMFAKDLARELGPRGIRVNGLLPGRVGTDRVLKIDDGAADPAAARAAVEATIPLRRYGNPDEFGRVAAFLMSPAASFVSGAMVPVDGGMLQAL